MIVVGEVYSVHGVGRRADVVLVAPNEVPQTGGDDDADKHDAGVVHGFEIDRDGSGHTEQRDGEEGPRCGMELVDYVC